MLFNVAEADYYKSTGCERTRRITETGHPGESPKFYLFCWYMVLVNDETFCHCL